MKIADILKEVKKGDIKNIYFSHGNEPYYIDTLSNWFEKNCLDEASKAFNQVVLYGKDTNARQIIDEARQYPMMGDKRLIILKEAQDMRSLNDLLEYITKPSPHTILVINYKHKKFDKRTKFAKAIVANAVVSESKKLYDNQVPAWIQSYAKTKGLNIGGREAAMLGEYLGTELSKVSNEIDKLVLNLGEGTTLTLDDIQEQIGISKEFNIFELQSALSSGDVVKSNLILNYFVSNPSSNPIQVVVSNLYSYFLKIALTVQNSAKSDGELQRVIGLSSPYFVKEYRKGAQRYPMDKLKTILLHIRKIDLQSKGLGNRRADNGALIKDLVYQILY